MAYDCLRANFMVSLHGFMALFTVFSFVLTVLYNCNSYKDRLGKTLLKTGVILEKLTYIYNGKRYLHPKFRADWTNNFRKPNDHSWNNIVVEIKRYRISSYRKILYTKSCFTTKKLYLENYWSYMNDSYIGLKNISKSVVYVHLSSIWASPITLQRSNRKSISCQIFGEG